MSSYFLDYVMSFDTADKMCVDEEGKPRPEKWIIRKAFDTPEDPYLPDEVLWRQKEQFSDGVGYGWIDGLKDHASSVRTNKIEPIIFEFVLFQFIIL